MAVNLSFIGGAGWQFFTDDGVPLSGGKIYTYVAGTTTPLATYTSRDGLTANANPIILDAAGRTPQQIWSTEGILYKYVVKDADDVLIRTWDNIGGSVVASDLAQSLANTTNNALGDALIGFRQSNSAGFWAGAAARTVNDKLQEYISPEDFGAVGDGIADDRLALQAAANTGLPLFLHGKSYFTTSTITINNDLIGPGEITGDKIGGAVSLLSVNSSNVSISNVTLTGNSGNNAAGANVCIAAADVSWLSILNCTIKNGRIRHRNTQLAYQYGLRIENCDIDCDFTLNDYIVTQNDVITVRGINGVWIENNSIKVTNCHRVVKLADTEGWVSGPITDYRTRNVSFCNNTITGATGSNKQVVDMFTGVSDAIFSGNNITVTGFTRVFENKTDSSAQPWNQNITISDNPCLSNDDVVLNFSGTYGDSDPAVDVGWQNLTISGNTIICTATTATAAVILRWQHDLIFTNNQIITPEANALTTGQNAVQVYGNRFCTFNGNTVKYGNILFSTIVTGGDRTHAPIMLSIIAANNTIEEFGSTTSISGRGGLVFANMATAETADLSVNVSGNAIYKSTSPVLTNAGAISFISCTIAKALVTSNIANFATASEERVTFVTSTITQFSAENNSWDFYGTAASASTVTLPGGQVVEITGTTNISTITATNNAGRRVSLIFRGVLTVNDGSNLKLAGNFTTSADDTLSLVCDGTNWYETARSAN